MDNDDNIEEADGTFYDHDRKQIVVRSSAKLSHWMNLWELAAKRVQAKADPVLDAKGNATNRRQPPEASATCEIRERMKGRAEIHWMLSYDQVKLTLGQAEQYSDDSMLSAWVRRVLIIDPDAPHTLRGRASANLRRRHFGESKGIRGRTQTSPIAASAGGATGMLVGGFGGLGVGELFALFPPMAFLVGAAGLGGLGVLAGDAAVKSAGYSDRFIERWHFHDSRALALAFRVWLDLVRAVREHPEQQTLRDSETDMHRVLWWAAELLEDSDQDTRVNYAKLDQIIPSVTEMADLAGSVIEAEQQKAEQFDTGKAAVVIAEDRLKEANEGLRNELTALREVYGDTQ